MCRLVLMNKQGEKEIERRYGLAEYFKYLEEQFGGHGNGFVAVKNKKIVKYEKGINLDVRDIAEKLLNIEYDWAIFHTRLASVGEKSDRNCHPFINKNNIMAMNGTEKSVSFLSDVMDITDTEAILSVISKFNLNITALTRLNSIFVGFHKGKPYMVANNTQNIKLLYAEGKNAIVFASEFPSKLKKDIYELKKSCYWTGGPINRQLIRKYKNTYKRLYNYWEYFDEITGQGYFRECNEVGDKRAV